MDWSEIENPEEWNFTTPIPSIKELGEFDKASTILDVGCGYGRTLEMLAHEGFVNLYGIDISPCFIKLAQKKCPKAFLHIGDCKNLNTYFDIEFDIVLVMGVLEYILTDQEQLDFFCNIKKILSPKGMLIIETFPIDLKNNWRQYLLGFLKSGHWGFFKNSKRFKCHHQSYYKLHRMINSIFRFVTIEKKKYRSWTNNTINGLTIIATNEGLYKF